MTPTRKGVRFVAVASLLVSATLLSGGRALGSPSAPGDQLWATIYDGPGSQFDEARAVTVSLDGTEVYVAGSSANGSLDYDATTAAYDAGTGSQDWIQRYDGPGHAFDSASAMTLSPDGTKVYVTGHSDGTDGLEDILTIAYDAAAGTPLWTSRYEVMGDKNDRGLSVAASPDGSMVYVVGYRNHSTRDDMAVLAYDAVTGSPVWQKFYNGPGSSHADHANAVAVSPDGSKVFVTGFSAAGSTSDVTTLALSSTGTPLWLKKYNGTGNSTDGGTAVTVSPDGSAVFVTGDSIATNFFNDYVTFAYDSTSGAVKWRRRYNGPAAKEDEARSIAVSPDGQRVFVTGLSAGVGTNWDYSTIAYDATTGSFVWGTRYDGPGSGDDFGESLGLSPDGSKLYVTGYGPGSNGDNDFATISYDAGTGGQLWLTRFDGADHSTDQAYALAVSPDGSKVLAVGSSYSNATADDFTTVAYQA